MLFIDYVPLMLINMSAGLFLLACFVLSGLNSTDQRKWSPGFAICGLVAFITGLHMVFHWPLPDSYNIAFGELSVLFGILFLGAAFALAKGWDLYPLAIYALFAGIAAVVLGIRIVDLSLTKAPRLSALGFIFSGLGGVFALPILYLRTNRTIQLLVAIVLLAASVIWALTAYFALWEHMEKCSDWVPTIMQKLQNQ